MLSKSLIQFSVDGWGCVPSLLLGLRPNFQPKPPERTTEDKMVGWHHQLNGHELEQAAGVSDGHGIWCVAVHGVAKNQTQLSN